MTDNTQPEAREFTMSQYASKDDMIGAMRKRMAELEAELEAVGAGGGSGPLTGKPQEMPDLSQLTERGAVAWAGVGAQGLREGRWYMVTHDGGVTLWLAEASTAGFTAVDMATAEARGFRDGAASAMAGEPMAWMTFTEEGDPAMVFLDRLEACQYCEDDDPPKPLYLAALSANAGEPVAWQYRSLRDNGAWFDCTKERFEMRCTQPEIWETRALYAAPPTAQAEPRRRALLHVPV